jgi:hypothetical protein
MLLKLQQKGRKFHNSSTEHGNPFSGTSQVALELTKSTLANVFLYRRLLDCNTYAVNFVNFVINQPKKFEYMAWSWDKLCSVTPDSCFLRGLQQIPSTALGTRVGRVAI